jgi:DNA-damage-inducible protein J
MSPKTMAQEARISSRIDADLKREADSILAEIGMKPSQAIALFYTQIVRQRGIPLSLKVPNEGLEEAMREARDPEFRKTARRYSSVDELMSDLDS